MTAKITLTWDNASRGHADQIVYRSAETFTSSNLPPILSRVGSHVREYIDTEIETGNVYFYAVASENAVGEILLSSVISVTAEAGAADPHWDDVIYLVHFDETLDNESSSFPNLIAPESPAVYEDGVFGKAARVHTNETRIVSADGSGEETEVELDLGGTFTIECFARMPSRTGSGDRAFVAQWDYRSTGNRIFFLGANNSRRLLFRVGTSKQIQTASLALDVWLHVAVSVVDGFAYIFADGQLVGSGQVGSVPQGAALLSVGFYYRNGSGSIYNARCNIDELRITKGVARYTENFTPPSVPFPNY